MKYRKLLAVMALKGVTAAELAKKIGISRGSMSRKLAGHNAFLLTEVQRIVKVLQLTVTEMLEIFFDKECPEQDTNGGAA